LDENTRRRLQALVENANKWIVKSESQANITKMNDVWKNARKYERAR